MSVAQRNLLAPQNPILPARAHLPSWRSAFRVVFATEFAHKDSKYNVGQ